MNQQIDTPQTSEDSIPDVTSCLEDNLKLLDQDSSTLLFDTIKFVYDVFTQEVSVGDRRDFLELVVHRVRSGDQDPAALLVFIHHETDPDIIRIAIWAYLKYRINSRDDLSLAIQIILSILVKRDIMNRGAVIAGLVCFGDQRVCSESCAVRDLITVKEALNFSNAVTSPLHRATAEFCLSWLVDLVSQANDEMMTQVASALSSMVISKPKVEDHDNQSNFGPYGFLSNHALPAVSVADLVADLSPSLDLLAKQDIPLLNEMIAILRDPSQTASDVLDRRKIPERRKATDRRIVQVMQQLERRATQRRIESRRSDRPH
jgi:hypothetical protein